MKEKRKKFVLVFSLCFLFSIMFSGCNSQNSHAPTQENSVQTDSFSNVPVKGTRDSTSSVLVPEATGTTVYSCEVASIDASNASEGYIMALYLGTTEKAKLQIKGPDGVTYTYNLHSNGYEVFPLTAGDGNYTVGIYENISGTKYSTALSTDISVTVTNTFGPYLYPNQYVNFTSSSLPVARAEELAYSANNDFEVVELVYNYMIENYTYDYDKAATVVSGYLPVVDEIYNAGTGICFDYTAVMATMLRSQNIPTRLEVGYVDEAYHAWISIYIEEIGWLNGIIEFDGTSWNLLDPTYASSSKSPKKFLTEDSKYLTKYVY